MVIKIFNTEINLRDNCCQMDNEPARPVNDAYINLYTLITNKCNADCKFCCASKKEGCFNIFKFKQAIKEIVKSARINKVSFTGGEPTLNPYVLYTCLSFVKSIDKNIFTVINTNGSYLEKISNSIPLLNSVALSRHHYDDKINQQIFNLALVPTAEEIKEFDLGEKLHLSCNLQKDYIGNKKEIIKYLEFADNIGCSDVGFVSLMKFNEYCEKQFVDFNDIKFDDKSGLFVIKNWNYENLCKCRNYIYLPESANPVSVYARHYVNPHFSGSCLVFDGQNLRTGFNGKIIY